MERVAAQSGGRQTVAAQYYVRLGWGAQAAGNRITLAAGLRELGSSPYRQRGMAAVSTGRLWRVDEFNAFGPARRIGSGRKRLAGAARADGFSRIVLERSGRRNLGGARPAPAFHSLQIMAW